MLTIRLLHSLTTDINFIRVLTKRKRNPKTLTLAIGDYKYMNQKQQKSRSAGEESIEES